MAECASVIGTKRQRYGAIERGESFVTAVELELLMRHLDIPMDAIWSGEGQSQRKIRQLPISDSPDETLLVVIDIQR
jgi:transcriptional regulator with XRE-family HTH domain